jgi:hypothetical protein
VHEQVLAGGRWEVLGIIERLEPVRHHDLAGGEVARRIDPSAPEVAGAQRDVVHPVRPG